MSASRMGWAVHTVSIVNIAKWCYVLSVAIERHFSDFHVRSLALHIFDFFLIIFICNTEHARMFNLLPLKR